MAGIVQLRNDTEVRRYYRRRLADGKTSMEAMRCLRRRLSDVVYRQLVQDGIRKDSPGRALGGVYVIQRGRPDPGHRLFGQATSRTCETDGTARPHSLEASLSGNRCPTATARQRRQRGAPRRTNDVDAARRHRTLGGVPDSYLTVGFIEGEP
jgi:hypothetical protein